MQLFILLRKGDPRLDDS